MWSHFPPIDPRASVLTPDKPGSLPFLRECAATVRDFIGLLVGVDDADTNTHGQRFQADRFASHRFTNSFTGRALQERHEKSRKPSSNPSVGLGRGED